MKFKFLWFFIFSILFSGCAKEKKVRDDTFVGGEIVNPKSSYFILSKENQVIDTLFLNQDNRFGKHFKNLEEGIYTFNHPPENQIMYLQPGDSILIWLNTMEFDESMHFSGTGANESNFLLEMFLNNEQNNELVLSYYRIPPEKFAGLTDSIRDSRIKIFDRLKNKKEYSPKFLQIARASIDYEFFHLRERYSFLTQKYMPEIAAQIPEDFHDYRKDIDFNNKNLSSFYVYTNFIDDFLRTQTIERCAESRETQDDYYNLNTFKNIKYRILLADSLLEEPSIKNKFLERLVAQAITFSDEPETIKASLKLFDSINYSGENLEDLKQIGQIQKSLLPGKNLGHLPFTNIAGDTVRLQEISDKPIISYHWSLHTRDHYYWQKNIIKNLRSKYPEVNFIGINIDDVATDSWAQIVEKESELPQNEFHLTFARINRQLLTPYLSKLLFIDEEGTIVQGSAQLNSPTFEREILEFINR